MRALLYVCAPPLAFLICGLVGGALFFLLWDLDGRPKVDRAEHQKAFNYICCACGAIGFVLTVIYLIHNS